MRQHFYHGTSRSYIAAFAAIFDGIFCNTDGGELTPVPLMYAQKQKFLEIVDDDPDKNVTDIEITMPRLAYELTGINYAPERHTNPMHMLAQPAARGVSFNRVPYDYSFSLYVLTRQFDDMLEIMEQVIPMFTPDFTVPIKEKIGDLVFDTNLTIVLNSVSFNVDYLGNFEEVRRLEGTINFTLKGYLYPRVGSAERIKEAIVKIFSMDDNVQLQSNTALVVPRTAGPLDPHTITEIQVNG